MPPIVRISPRVLPYAHGLANPEDLVIGAADIAAGEAQRREEAAVRAEELAAEREHEMDVIGEQGSQRMREIGARGLFDRELLGLRFAHETSESALDRELTRDVEGGRLGVQREGMDLERDIADQRDRLARDLGTQDLHLGMARVNADLLLGRDRQGSRFPLSSSLPFLFEEGAFGVFGVDPSEDILQRAQEFAAGGTMSGGTVRTPPMGGGGIGAGAGTTPPAPDMRLSLQQHMQILPHIPDETTLEHYLFELGAGEEEAQLLREEWRRRRQQGR